MVETLEQPQQAIDEEAQTDVQPEATKEAKQGEPFEVAILPLQNTTLFPETVVPLAVGRPRSVAAG